MADYQPDTGLKMLKGRLGAILVMLITQILVAKFGIKVDEASKEMILELVGILLELGGIFIAMGMCALSKFLEKQKLADSG